MSVVDRNGVEIGWITTDSGSGEEWDALVRQEFAGLRLPSESVGGAVVIRTTIDSTLQQNLVDSVGIVPDTQGRFAVAAVALDVVDGGIIAIADSSSAGDLSGIRRPTGSALKFLIATAAIEAGAQGGDLLDGANGCAVPSPSGVTVFSGDPAYALAPLTEMTAFSVNCAFGKLYAMVGGERVLRLAADLGLSGVDRDTPGIATGALRETPLEMAAAMRAVLGGGTHARPFVIDQVTGGSGATIYAHVRDDKQVLSSDVADETAALLTNVVSHGTARSAALDEGRTAAAKTGTQQGNTDAWLVGGTAQLSVAVWMGNPVNEGDGMVDVPEYHGVPRVQGGTYPARVWKNFLDSSLAGSPAMSWPEAEPRRDPLRLFLPDVECPLHRLDRSIELPAVDTESPIELC